MRQLGNLVPIPIEMVETMAENVESAKANESLISSLGSAAVGLALGLIYPPSMWIIGWTGFTVYGVINAYLVSNGG